MNLTKYPIKLVDVQTEERKILLWSWLYVVVLFMAYYVLRPIRDELGAAGGTDKLPWLFTATLLAMLALTPLYGWLVKRFDRRRLIACSYRFFMANLLVFSALMAFGSDTVSVWTGRAFFVWVSVFNLFVVSVFWSLMSDVFRTEQSKRLFGFLHRGRLWAGCSARQLSRYLPINSTAICGFCWRCCCWKRRCRQQGQ